MTLEEGLFAYLSGHPTVGPLFVNATSPLTWRIYPEFQEGTAYPALVYARVSTPQIVTLSGPINFNTVRMQLDVWHNSADGCRTAADAVRAAVNGVRDTLGGVSIDHGYVDSYSTQSERDGDRTDYRRTMDLIVILTE